ncbi:Aste57867_2856 [Aphanomyces stellatus]|uniref:Aste57867_2856 protein n=1 Tax=Aphanomyces stellatus TaxID=120398 RepID=A0A485KE59_9STRA|nr:hypothetical protein As57867_002848 [Aphanomyces stellatus]VFT80043.1 Aste57867_2856 [Aphanomyces stellatus]
MKRLKTFHHDGVVHPLVLGIPLTIACFIQDRATFFRFVVATRVVEPTGPLEHFFTLAQRYKLGLLWPELHLTPDVLNSIEHLTYVLRFYPVVSIECNVDLAWLACYVNPNTPLSWSWFPSFAWEPSCLDHWFTAWSTGFRITSIGWHSDNLAIDAFAAVVRHLRHLKHIDVVIDVCPTHFLVNLFALAATSTTLKSIMLEDEGGHAVSGQMLQHATTWLERCPVTMFRFHRWDWSTTVAPGIVTAFVRALFRHPTLQLLHIEQCNLVRVPVLSMGGPLFPALWQLHFESVYAPADTAAWLPMVLFHSPIHELILPNVVCSASAHIRILRALKFSHLNELDLTGWSLAPIWGIAVSCLSTALVRQLTLTDPGDGINDDSLAGIAQIIATNETLTHVTVRVSHTTTAMVALMSAMMDREASLECLCLVGVERVQHSEADATMLAELAADHQVELSGELGSICRLQITPLE